MFIKYDPGPCPVDDCPHHTCVNPETPLAAVVLARRDGVAPGSLTITTASYTRAAWAAAVRRTIAAGEPR